jgi:hypothetical protein
MSETAGLDRDDVETFQTASIVSVKDAGRA